jgi:hypothetical protein
MTWNLSQKLEYIVRTWYTLAALCNLILYQLHNRSLFKSLFMTHMFSALFYTIIPFNSFYHNTSRRFKLEYSTAWEMLGIFFWLE